MRRERVGDQRRVFLTLKAATLPTGTVYGLQRGQGLDSNFVHEGGW